MIKSGERRADARQQEGEFVRIPYAEMGLLSTFCRPLRMRRYQQPGGSIAIVGWRSPSRSSGWSRAPFGIYTNRTIGHRVVVALRDLLFGSAVLAQRVGVALHHPLNGRFDHRWISSRNEGRLRTLRHPVQNQRPRP